LLVVGIDWLLAGLSGAAPSKKTKLIAPASQVRIQERINAGTS
jgi:hypothetical protein